MTPSEDKSPLDQAVDYVANIGPKRAEALKTVGVRTIEDLLYYFPRRYLDRSNITRIADLKDGQEATVIAKVVNMGVMRGRKKRFALVVTDDTDTMTMIWFSQMNYWTKIFRVGEWLALSGKVTLFGTLQMTHPDFEKMGREDSPSDLIHGGKIIPVYPSSEPLTKVGLDSRGMRRIMNAVVKTYLPNVSEILPESTIRRRHLIGLSAALFGIHFPKDFETMQKSRDRLKFDELFFMELMLAFRKRQYQTAQGGISFEKIGPRVRQLIEKLPFELTEAQKRVLREIVADMKSAAPMNRLLQGDVGSGKTIVALVAMLIAVENGYQAALMAPTEILAEQHYLTMRQLLEELQISTLLLVGKHSPSLKNDLHEKVATGSASLVIGTHALIQDKVVFANLGLVIIDEQHRFGVMQRAALRTKGVTPDVLVMTATPIPRTLSMTLYGDLDISLLDELPAGRRPIKTFWRMQNKRLKIYEFVRQKLSEGAQVYIVFPLVEESEKIDLKAATESYEKMKDSFFVNFKIGLLHGQMSSIEKETAMTQFKNGEIQVLVSTTVIEVGVDVPNATIMVIEHAERFGLMQLHQLRGRVGRGSKQSYCLLIAYGDLADGTRLRLDALAATNDGFKIAEMDLKLRGPGEIFGTRQHGLPELRIANPVQDLQHLRAAREEAFRLVKEDPQLLNQEDTLTRRYFMKNYLDQYDLAWVG